MVSHGGAKLSGLCLIQPEPDAVVPLRVNLVGRTSGASDTEHFVGDPSARWGDKMRQVSSPLCTVREGARAPTGAAPSPPPLAEPWATYLAEGTHQVSARGRVEPVRFVLLAVEEDHFFRSDTGKKKLDTTESPAPASRLGS